MGVLVLKLLAALLILGWSLAPIVFMLLSSFKPGQDIFAVPPRLVFTPTLQHYIDLWARWGIFFKGLFNSLVITTGAARVGVTASTMAGFA